MPKTSAVASAVWYRGNTHAHTNNSDGDSSPAAVAAAYKALGYNFLFITDHNKLTDVTTLNSQLGVPGQFLVIKGEEVTDSFNGSPVHLNGLNNNASISPQHGGDVLTTIENDVAAIKQAGGLPYIAHPNYGFAISSDDLKSVTGTALFEIHNAHPVVNNYGDATHPSVEAMWDTALSSGKLLYGLAADDEHTLINQAGALPGRAWIMVKAASLDPDTITQAISKGNFYASTGVLLQDYEVTATHVSLTFDTVVNPGATVDFIGRNGQLLQRNTTSPAQYTFTGHEQYVRARIGDTAGKSAWTQPVFTEWIDPAAGILNGASLGNEPNGGLMIAPDSVAIASGLGLAGTAIQAHRQPDGTYPTILGGTSVTVNDQTAEVYYVSSEQVNFHVPPDTEPGAAEVAVTNTDGVTLRSQITVAPVAPGLFTADGSGIGTAVVFDVERLLGKTLMPDDALRHFYLYATGARSAKNLQVLINGQPVTVESIRKCNGLPGLDQISIAFPQSMTSAGLLSVVIQTDGVASNPVTLPL